MTTAALPVEEISDCSLKSLLPGQPPIAARIWIRETTVFRPASLIGLSISFLLTAQTRSGLCSFPSLNID